MKEYITLTVDGKSVKIEKGSTLLEAARKAGADIPTLCHDERVKPYGACGIRRMRNVRCRVQGQSEADALLRH